MHTKIPISAFVAYKGLGAQEHGGLELLGVSGTKCPSHFSLSSVQLVMRNTDNEGQAVSF